jgi:hypothetical protein
VSHIELNNHNLCFFPHENFHTYVPYPILWVKALAEKALIIDLESGEIEDEPPDKSKSPRKVISPSKVENSLSVIKSAVG